MPVKDRSAADNDLALRENVVAGVFQSSDAADRAVDELMRAGWPRESIGVAYQGEGERFEHRSASDTKAGEGAVKGIAAGGAIGGVAGLIAGIAAITVPGLGLLVAAGPLGAAIAGASMGGAMGGLVGSFEGLGIPTEDAKHYDRAVREGGLFVSARAKDDAEAQRVRDLLDRAGAEAVNSYVAQL
jgi:hypothetical protein